MPTTITDIHTNRGGGRIASPAYRQSLALCDDFAGLEADVNRYQLLILVKRVGKAAGFTSRLIQLLDYYMAFTRDADWEEGSRPIVYQSVSRTALDLGVSERQVQKLEAALFAAGAITWSDSGNHRRYGQRDPATGRILYAFGVDLAPLAYLRGELEAKLHEKQLYDEAWLETKRQISWHRRQVRSALLEQEEGALSGEWLNIAARYETIACQIRTHMGLEQLRRLLAEHQALYADTRRLLPDTEVVNATRKTSTCSSISERTFAHYKYTTQESSDKSDTVSPADHCFQESVAEPSQTFDPLLASGMQHITLRQVVVAASDRFQEHLPRSNRPLNWNDITDAAAKLRPELGVSQASWVEACQLLGRGGASVCLLLTDHAAQRSHDPAARPAAYFRGMLNKARSGELRLHNSIFGLLERAVSSEEAS